MVGLQVFSLLFSRKINLQTHIYPSLLCKGPIKILIFASDIPNGNLILSPWHRPINILLSAQICATDFPHLRSLKPDDFRVPSNPNHSMFLWLFAFLPPLNEPSENSKHQQTHSVFCWLLPPCLCQTPFPRLSPIPWMSISSSLDLSLIPPSKLCLAFADSPWQITLQPPLSDPSAKPVAQGLLCLPQGVFLCLPHV